MQQDYTFNLEPGERQFITLGEIQFIFIKVADRPVVLTVDGYSQVMEVNQKTRSEFRFNRFELENPDQELPLKVTIVAGLGDYTSQAIKGQLNVVPSVIKADGSILPDDRFFLDLHIAPDQNFTTLTVAAGEIIKRQKLRDHVVGEHPFGDAFQGAMLIAQDQENGGGAGWLKLDHRTFDGDLIETRQLNYLVDNKSFRAGSLAAIDDEYFFLSGYLAPAPSFDYRPAVWLCRWHGTVVEMVQSAPIYEGDLLQYTTANSWNEAVCVHYDMDTRKLWCGHKNVSNKDLVTLAELDYNPSLQTVALASKTDYDTDGSDTRVMSIGRVNDELLLSLLVFEDNSQQIYRVDDGALLWVDEIQKLNPSHFIVGIAEVDAILYTVESDKTDNNVYLAQRYPRAATYNFSGRVLEPLEACFGGIFKPITSNVTEAIVTAENIGGPRFKVSGEVIRAALELFFGGPIVTGYLDSVYGIEIEDTASQPRIYKFYSGNASFRRFGRADDFSIMVPSTLRLYVDSTFWSLKA